VQLFWVDMAWNWFVVVAPALLLDFLSALSELRADTLLVLPVVA
jgi:hypothetical protein